MGSANLSRFPVELALHPSVHRALGASRWLGTEPDQVVGPFATFALPGDTYVAGTIVEVDDEHVMVQTHGRRARITFKPQTSSAVARVGYPMSNAPS